MKNLMTLLVTCALAMTACSATETKGKIGSPAPALSGMTWIQGGPVEIKKGQVAVVEFWATWCPPCRATIPHLNDLYKRYATNDVAFVGISNERVDSVKAFVKQMGDKMTYPVAIGAQEVHAGYMGAFGVNGIPHAFVVDADGNIAWHGHPMDNLDKAIDAALGEAPGKAPAPAVSGAKTPKAPAKVPAGINPKQTSDDSTYGYTKENPVKLGSREEFGGPAASRVYLQHLRDSKFKPFTFDRDGSFGGGPDDHILDRYTLVDSDGNPHQIFIDMYHPENAPLKCKAPKGMYFSK